MVHGGEQLPGEHAKEDRAERVPVRRRRQVLASRLLGCHVRGRTANVGVTGGALHIERHVADQPEVEHDDATVVPHHHVRWLEIEVKLARLVDGRNGGSELAEGRAQASHVGARAAAHGRWRHRASRVRGGALLGQGFAWLERAPFLKSDRQRRVERAARRHLPTGLSGLLREAVQSLRVRPAHPLDEVDTLDELHREEPLIRGGDELVEHDQVRVRHVGERAKLLLHPVHRAGVHPRQHLERDVRPAFPVVGAIDDTHPAPTELTLELEALTKGEGRLEFVGVEGFLHPTSIRTA